MQENQSREQYWFEDETLAWLETLISRTERVGAVFMPSLLKFPNVHVFDADERFAGSERYTKLDVTRTVPDLSAYGMVLMDPPFALTPRHLGPLLAAAKGRPILLSTTDWCVACGGWGDLFLLHGLSQVTTYFPRYRSIGNGYCEETLKRDGRTNISFYSNVPFGPARRPVVLRESSGWTTHDPYAFRPLHTSESPPAEQPASSAAPLPLPAAKALEIEEHWPKMQKLRRRGWRRRLKLALGIITGG